MVAIGVARRQRTLQYIGSTYACKYFSFFVFLRGKQLFKQKWKNVTRSDGHFNLRHSFLLNSVNI